MEMSGLGLLENKTKQKAWCIGVGSPKLQKQASEFRGVLMHG